jgi:FAD-dependent oxidoreductase domain-containing protein 1
MANTSDLAAGCHGLTGEGWFDGYGLMQAFRKKARSLGVDYCPEKLQSIRKPVETGLCASPMGPLSQRRVWSIAPGPPAVAEMCRQAGIEVPIVPKKRCVFTFECRDDLANFPLLIDPTGTYVRPEGTGYICGSAPPADQDPDATDFDVDYGLFEEHIWPVLAPRARLRGDQAWRCLGWHLRYEPL